MQCPLCNNPETAPALKGSDRFLKTTPRVFQLSSCRACDCLFIDPQPKEAELPAFYPESYWQAGLPGRLGAVERFYRWAVLRDHVTFIRQTARRIPGSSGPPRLLDVGCGSGMLLEAVRRRGFAVTGIDVSPDAARAAEEAHGIPVRVGALESMAFETGSFDIVTMFHTIEHVADPRNTLAEACRVLQPDGRLILQAPNIRSWQSRLLGSRWHGLDIPRHTIDYSPNAIRRLLEACGFRMERARNFNLRDNAPALASSVAPALDPARRKTISLIGRKEPPVLAWAGHLLYLGLVALSYPFALLEAAAGSGATIMIEARKA